MSNLKRLGHIDGLRFISILFVVLFHYYSRWSNDPIVKDVYPYGSKNFLHLISENGYIGVYIFFCISGYVIAYTIKDAHSFFQFWINRFIRLWPVGLIYTLITFITLSIINTPFPQRICNLLPSLTYYPFSFDGSCTYVDGVMWSLFVEVRFYFIVSLFYFCFRAKGYLSLMVFLFILSILSLFNFGPNINFVIFLLNKIFIIKNLSYFFIGVAIFQWKNEKDHLNFICSICIVLISLLFSKNDLSIPQTITVYLIFLLPFFSGILRNLLSLSTISGFGQSSYGMYLIHQALGLTVLGLLCELLNLSQIASFYFSIFFIAILFAISRFFYLSFEVPLQKKLRFIMSSK